mmetsp:Transcript_23152/g.38280  ORF Transcript_23152/g.38280 Transcript_23152/m.38280 type:complete len:186 (+) Transcript_23152:172-729(+)|eukprot:CAMPEP_0119027566 /NCGR_PEP_ID=MMETSP1176-20130426/37296_1 /TAXON_ID=265551 /ORGANISM="Synedropsis recta cf, Strain CCMP1620" /LENGTH=185 /DNA_ID=CAMNT_0006983507 /DNA_START=118 /DNA_END=675 /DNA_ORIENTATION=+
MSSLARQTTRMTMSSQAGESLLIPVSLASALFAAGVGVLMKPRRSSSSDNTNKKESSDKEEDGTVVTESDSRDGAAPVSPALSEQEDHVAPVMEVTTTKQVQVEEMSQQDSTDDDGTSVATPTPEPITTAAPEQSIDCASSVASTSSRSGRIFKSSPRKDFCRITSGLLERALDDDEISCDSVHC